MLGFSDLGVTLAFLATVGSGAFWVGHGFLRQSPKENAMPPFRLPAALVALTLAIAPFAGRAQSDEKITFEPSGWLVLNTFYNDGNLNAVDLPRWALPSPVANDEESALGMAVRQSRVRLGIGVPTDGLVSGSKLRGFLEIDFMGGNAGNGPDDSLPLLRLRHAYVTVGWKDLGNLTVLAGQTWAIFGGPFFADSLGHLAIPRFGGAGFLFRRAPQVRVSGDVGQKFALVYALGVLSPADQSRPAPPPPTGTVTPAALPAQAGYRSGLPNLEGRVAMAYRPAPKRGVEIGVSGQVGREKYLLNGLGVPENDELTSSGGAIDAKLDLPYLTIKGAAFTGENLDVYYSFAPGVAQTATNGALTAVSNVETRGFWAQAVVSPVKQVSLVLGMGMEEPQTDGPAQLKNTQYSGGIIGNLSSRWRTSLEYTRYETEMTTGNDDGGQVELSALLAF